MLAIPLRRDRSADEAGRPGGGVEHVCADGSNAGEKLVHGFTDGGSKFQVDFQVMDVDRPLVAVSKLTAAGHDVCLREKQGVLMHWQTGKQTPFQNDNWAYVLRIWSPRTAFASPGGSSQ